MAFKIITDSASDLPRELIDKYQIHVIPTPVTINGTDYFDGKTIFPEEFYKIQAEGADIKTYHINQYMFYENFKPYAEAGDEVLYLCFSTGIAGTFNAANLAKEQLLEEYPDFQITIIDTKCASMGFGLVVYKCLRMQENGAPKDLIIEAAQYFSAACRAFIKQRGIPFRFHCRRFRRLFRFVVICEYIRRRYLGSVHTRSVTEYHGKRLVKYTALFKQISEIGCAVTSYGYIFVHCILRFDPVAVYYPTSILTTDKSLNAHYKFFFNFITEYAGNSSVSVRTVIKQRLPPFSQAAVSKSRSWVCSKKSGSPDGLPLSDFTICCVDVTARR